jgi:hypothetical protein
MFGKSITRTMIRKLSKPLLESTDAVGYIGVVENPEAFVKL